MLSKICSYSDLQFWAQERSHSTILYDTMLTNYSPALRVILNKDSEFQMGDSVIWFHSGNLYSYIQDATFVNDLKANPESYKSSGYFFSQK
jgi:hypothetical protein